MNKFLRAIGFSEYKKPSDIRPVLDAILADPERLSIEEADGEETGYMSQSFGDGIGLKLFVDRPSGSMQKEETFFPYLNGRLATEIPCSIEKRSGRDGYLGMCDLPGGNINMIFFITNSEDCTDAIRTGETPQAIYVSGLSTEGKIILPLKKSARERQLVSKVMGKKAGLMEAATDGDENAIESLTLEEMRLTHEIAERLDNEDIYTIIDTYFMPSGMESDRYSLIGEITGVSLIENTLTGEPLYKLDLASNDLRLQVIINCCDLLGEPAVGRRFKGEIWLQGRVIFS